MRKIPGIYVPVRLDKSNVQRDMTQVRQVITEQAKGMSTALNNALGSDQIKKSLHTLVNNLDNLARAAKTTDFSKIGVDLKDLQRVTGTTGAEFQKLQAKLLATQAATVQEKSLRSIAQAAGLTRDEIKLMGTQFGLSEAQIEKVSTALHGAEVRVKSLSERIAAMPAIKNYTTLASSSTSSLNTQANAKTEGFARDLVAMTSGADIAHKAFDLLKLDMDALSKATGLTAEQIGILKTKFATSAGEQVQANALRNIATAAALTRAEIAQMGAQMGISAKNIGLIQTAVHGALPPLKSLVLLSGEAQASLAGGMGSAVKSFATDLTALSQGGKIAGNMMNGLSVDLTELRRHVGMTEAEFSKLQSQLMKTQGEKAQENALRNIAKSANLTEKEIRTLGAQMNVSQPSINKVTKEMDALGKSDGFNAAKWKDMIVSIGLYTVAFGALYGVIGGIKNEFVRGLKAVEDFDMSIVETTALITTFSERAKNGDVAGAYIEANAYAEKLVSTLEMIDTRTIANSKDLRAMSQAFIENGVQVEVANKKQLDGFTAVANALAVLTKGQNREIQMRQEIKGLMDGEIRASDRLGTMLKAMVPDIEKQLRVWREQGTTLENLGQLLSGFDVATKDLENQWSTVGSTMETIHDRILRGMFEPVFKDLIALAKELNQSLMDTEGNLTPLARGMIKLANDGYEAAKKMASSGTLTAPLKGMVPGLQAGSAAWKLMGAEVDFVKGKIEDYGRTSAEQVNSSISELQAELERLQSGDLKWYEKALPESLISSKVASIKTELQDLQATLREIQDGGDNWTAPATAAPKLIRPPADATGGKSLASDQNAALQAQVEYLKAIEEKKAAIKKAAIALDQQQNEQAYALGLESYRTYLDTRNKLTEAGLQADLDAKKKELADAEKALTKLKPITDKEGKSRPDKDAKAQADAMKKVEDATKDVIEAQNKLDIARKEGTHEVIVAADEQIRAYKQIEIQLLEMQGKTIEAAKAQMELEKESAEYKQILAAAREKDADAQRALFDIERQNSIVLRNLQLEEARGRKEALLNIAELNGEHQKALQLKIGLLDIEKQIAVLNGASSERVDLYRREREELEKMTTEAGAFAKGWKDATSDWGNNIQRMVNLASDAANAMHSSFEDVFFDALEGDMKSFMDYFKGFLSSLNRALAKFWADWLVGSMTNSSSGGGGGWLSWITGLFSSGAGAASGGTSVGAAEGWHSGGVHGVDKPSFTRAVSPEVFTGAKRYHSGLKSDEFPAILQRGEAVFTRGQLEALGQHVVPRHGSDGGRGGSVSISVPVSVEDKSKRWSKELQHEIENTVERYLRRQAA